MADLRQAPVTVFLTGASGFIGRNLAVRLAGEGFRAVCLVRDPRKVAWMGDFPALKAVPGDLSEPSSLLPHLADCRIVIHLAGLTKARNREEYFRGNARATENLARAMASPGIRVERAVYLSSLAVAGPRTKERPAREDEEPKPITWYGESKLQGERSFVARCGDIPWTIIRPPVVYGPWDRAVFQFFRAAAFGLVPVMASGRLELSLIHVDDLVESLLLAVRSDRSAGRVYYVSDGSVHTSGELAARVRSVMGKGFMLPVPAGALKLLGHLTAAASRITGKAGLLNPQKVRETLSGGWVCAIDRARAELGYVPKVDLDEGLGSTLAWYRRNGWI